jgi:hypothetical protein
MKFDEQLGDFDRLPVADFDHLEQYAYLANRKGLLVLHSQ